MSYCEDYGIKPAEESGYNTDNAAAASNTSTYVVNGGVTYDKICYSEDERQSILDTMRKKLIGERRTWIIISILYIVAYLSCISLCAVSFVSIIVTAPSDDSYYYEEEPFDYSGPYTEMSMEIEDDDEYSEEMTDETMLYTILFMFSWFGTVYGIYIFIPPAVIGFIMAAKLNKALKKLYTDCSLAYRRCSSPLSIVFGAIFNWWTLIFSIPLFVLSRKNRELLMEIAEIQKGYYG